MTAIEDLAARLAILEDREACRQLIARYGPMADAGDHEGAASLFASDGSYDVGGFGTYAGSEAIGALLQCEEHLGLIASGAAHVLSDPVIELDGNKAHVFTYSIVLRRSGEAWVPHRVSANIWHLVREAHCWHVAHRANRLLDGSDDTRGMLREWAADMRRGDPSRESSGRL
ncbi:nuclear transport factor 2 family protein [Novosphingobium sp. P6W]|uniref:nuclear transport factor 2 family protein n=1 Tax=Novosphingobium sp. P6W TaxID=1609758 RepID=UPI00069743E7|nr:nuclear transport factor 2 family protein [Novosphingobium sp. P6W]